MIPIYENIAVALNTSLKVATYTHGKTCPTANWHIHPEYELVYVRNGSGILKIDSKTIPYMNGALLFLGPNIPHADFGNKDFKNNFEVVIQFTSKFVTEKLSVFPESRVLKKLIQASHNGLVFDTRTKEKLSPTFEALETANAMEKLIGFLNILTQLSHTNRHERILPERGDTNHKTIDVQRLETIFQFVNEHYGEQLSVEKPAGHIGLTPNSFCRFFKKMTKKTFIQFVNEFRIGKAVELFNENSMSVSEVMYRCGFNDPSYFTRQFKKYQEKTPTAYLLQ